MKATGRESRARDRDGGAIPAGRSRRGRRPPSPGQACLAMTIRESVIAALRDAADPARAPQQQAYMKSDMPFFGVGVPQCRRIAGAVFKALPLPDARAWEAAILDLWRNAAHREERYAAIELLLFRPYVRWLEPATLPLVEELVVTGAWWDYVDAIAGRGVGAMLAAHPRPMKAALREWAHDDDIWKRRTAILAQLRARQATDTELLADTIRPSIGEAEVLSAQGHRLGAPRVLQDRSGLGDGVRPKPCRALHAEPARGAQAPGAHEQGRLRARREADRRVRAPPACISSAGHQGYCDGVARGRETEPPLVSRSVGARLTARCFVTTVRRGGRRCGARPGRCRRRTRAGALPSRAGARRAPRPSDANPGCTPGRWR